MNGDLHLMAYVQGERQLARDAERLRAVRDFPGRSERQRPGRARDVVERLRVPVPRRAPSVAPPCCPA